MNLRIVVRPGVALALMLAACAAGVALLAARAERAAPSSPELVRLRKPVPTPEPSEKASEQARDRVELLAMTERDARARRRFLSECVDRGGRWCCGQGGCCGLEDAVIAPTVTMSFPLVDGALPTRAVETVLHAQGTALTGCYEQARIEPTYFEIVSFELAIDEHGKAAPVATNGFDVAVGSCIANVLQSVSYPKPDRGSVRVLGSFQFRPERGTHHESPAGGRIETARRR
jgi:hypothetical protein